VGALVVSPDALFTSRRDQLVALAASYRVPTIYHLREAATINHPGGNVTGVNFLINALGGKRLQLIRELVSAATVIGLLVNPNAPGADLDRHEAERVAETVGQKLVVLNVSREDDFKSAFAIIIRERVGALVVSPDALFTSRRDQLVALAASYRVPTIYHLREAATIGGLMSYGTSITDAHRRAGAYTGRILKGERPESLPIEQSTKFELVINLRTARALGLTVPDKLLALADEVIE
jgi:putative ABC transport system substrate-binding protein